MGGIALRMSGVRKRLGGHEALAGIDLEVPDRAVVAVLGPSGGGKSTLLRCAAMLEIPDGGEIHLEGENLTAARGERLRRLRTHVGMVFQHFHLFPHLTALENVALGLVHTLGLSRAEAAERARAALDRVGLSDKADAFPRHLSGGQQQRVAIARATAMRPRLMLFDEPTSALDAEMVAEVLSVMRALVAEGMTMLVVSHEIGFVRSAADRVVFLAEGRILEDRPTAEFLAAPEDERARRFISAIL